MRCMGRRLSVKRLTKRIRKLITKTKERKTKVKDYFTTLYNRDMQNKNEAIIMA